MMTQAAFKQPPTSPGGTNNISSMNWESTKGEDKTLIFQASFFISSHKRSHGSMVRQHLSFSILSLKLVISPACFCITYHHDMIHLAQHGNSIAIEVTLCNQAEQTDGDRRCNQVGFEGALYGLYT